MRCFLTRERLVSITAVMRSSWIFLVPELSTFSVSLIAGIIPLRPTLAHPVIRKPNYDHTASLVLPHCLCQATVQDKYMCKQLRMI